MRASLSAAGGSGASAGFTAWAGTGGTNADSAGFDCIRYQAVKPINPAATAATTIQRRWLMPIEQARALRHFSAEGLYRDSRRPEPRTRASRARASRSSGRSESALAQALRNLSVLSADSFRCPLRS